MKGKRGFVCKVATVMFILAASASCRGARPAPESAPTRSASAGPVQTVDFQDIDFPEARLRITREGPSPAPVPAEILRLSVKVADDVQSRSRGLMFVDRLPRDSGMVFLYDRPSESSFYMKNTLIPLDIAFWGEDRKIHQIMQMPPCKTDPCPTYKPRLPFTGALEVNRGLLKREGVRSGDTVTVTVHTAAGGQAPA